MSRKMTRILTIIMALLMVLTLGACNASDADETTEPSNTTNKTNAPDAPETTTEDLLAETMEIAWGGSSTNNIEDGGIIQNALEEKFNVELTIVGVELNNNEKINLMMSAGDIPDVFVTGNTDTAEYYENGFINEIPIDMIKQYAPLFTEFLDTKEGGWNYLKSPDSDNCMIGLAGTDDTIVGTYIVPTYRLDWLLNEDCPVQPKGDLIDIDGEGNVFYTTEAFTMDEFEQILDYFANGDPDGNGVDDTYGICPSTADDGLNMYTYRTILGSFGLGDSIKYNYNIDGKAVHQYENPQIKKVIKLLNKWYEMGIIDPEFLTNSFTDMNEKLGNGMGGYANVQISYFNYLNDSLQAFFPANVLAANEKAKILVTPPEIGEYQGEQRYYAVSTLGRNTTIGKGVSDEKLARILMMFDFINFTDEGYSLSRYGIEGDTFEWTGEAFNSSVNWLKQDEPNGYSFFNGSYYTQFYMDINYTAGQNVLVDYFQNGEGAQYASIKTYKNDFYNTTDWVSVTQKYGTALKTLYTEFLTLGILGEIDPDTDWDKYISDLYASGLDELLVEIENMPTVEELTR